MVTSIINQRRAALWALMLVVFLLGGCGHALSRQELEAKYAPPPSKFVEIDGTRIHYRDEGSGPTVIMIHGVLASLHTWDGWAADLRKDHRVIRFDTPAFGLTGPLASGEYNRDNYLKLFDQFLSKVGAPEKFTLVGNSLGGYFAWSYAAKSPERVERVALLDAAAYPQEMPFVLKLVKAPLVRNAPARLTPEFIVRQNVESVYGDAGRIRPGTVELYHDLAMYPGNREASVKLFDYMETLTKEEPVGLKTLKMPVLVMWGEKDTWVPFNARWRQDVPQARFVTYPGVGHVPMEEIPEQSVRDFRDWLKS